MLKGIAIVAGMFALANPAYAQMEAASDKTDPVLVYRQAGVSPQQESLIRHLAEEFEKAARVRVERIRNLSKQLSELSYSPELDEKQVLGIQDEMNDLHAKISTERVKLMLNIRNLLSTEQKEKLVELLKEKKGESASAATPSSNKMDAAQSKL